MAAPAESPAGSPAASPVQRWTAPAREAPGAFVQWLRGWAAIVRLGAWLGALALSPASYDRPTRRLILQQVYLGSAPGLAWFTLLSSLFGLVLIRIVTVTAVSYGLTPYALEMVVRVLVLELIPLSAALFVAMRYSLPQRALLSRMRREGQLGDTVVAGAVPATPLLQSLLLPRVIAGVVAVWMLAALSCLLALVIAYLSVYGLSPWALEAYTRVVGSVFNPAVSLIFVLKTLGFSAAVAVIPLASALYDAPRARRAGSAELRTLVRLFMVLLLIEAVSLLGNYG